MVIILCKIVSREMDSDQREKKDKEVGETKREKEKYSETKSRERVVGREGGREREKKIDREKT